MEDISSKKGQWSSLNQISFDTNYYGIKLQTIFEHNGNNEQISDYLSNYVGGIITGATSGVTARVVGFDEQLLQTHLRYM